MQSHSVPYAIIVYTMISYQARCREVLGPRRPKSRIASVVSPRHAGGTCDRPTQGLRHSFTQLCIVVRCFVLGKNGKFGVLRPRTHGWSTTSLRRRDTAAGRVSVQIWLGVVYFVLLGAFCCLNLRLRKNGIHVATRRQEPRGSPEDVVHNAGPTPADTLFPMRWRRRVSTHPLNRLRAR